MTTQIPDITLNNGVAMPVLGLGVMQATSEEAQTAVTTALGLGYRHIDTAAAYGNEREVGEGVRASTVERSDVFLETKIWISDYGYTETLHAFDKSAAKLGVAAIDLLILHQPVPSSFDRTLQAYRALEDLLSDGKVRAIGVSNFMLEDLERLMEHATVVPAVNQIEVHPYFSRFIRTSNNAPCRRSTLSTASRRRLGRRSGVSPSTWTAYTAARSKIA